jgi:flagellar biosynthesis chaperone FliJ
MKLSEIKSVISQVLAEAKEAGLPKSGNKLVELKKELASLKKMQESVSQLSLNENDSDTLVAEYIHMQKYVNEYNKIKDSSAKLSEMLGNQISEVENKISAETQKIKEMMGLVEPAAKKVEGKKAPKKDEPKKEEPKKVEKKEEIKEGTLNETPTMDFINAVKDLDPAALTALGVSALPVGAALKVIADFIRDKRPTKDKLKDLNKTIAATR